jgi:hypothetical protein
MDNGVLKRIESWESRFFSNGGLKIEELLSSGFSGMIESEMEWMFILNGRIIGYQGDRIQEFGKKEGKVYTAPHPALPILFYMQVSEKIGESMQYYTEEKSIEEIDATLKENKFTGYIELADDVLSGDYYIVYHGGRSMDVAFIGNMDRLISEEESRRSIKDEIGIYQVNHVNIKPIDITVKDPEKKKVAGGLIESENVKLEEKHAKITENKEWPTQLEGMENNAIGEMTEREGNGRDKFEHEVAWRVSRVVPSIDPRKDGELVKLLKESTEWKTDDKNRGKEVQSNENVPSKKVEVEEEYITEKEEVYEKIVEEVEEIIEDRVEEIIEEDTDKMTGWGAENIELEKDENLIELISSDRELMKGNVSVNKKVVDAKYAMESAIVFVRYKNPSGPTIIKSLKRKEKIGKDAVNRNLNYGNNIQISGINEGITLVEGNNGEPEEFKEYLEKSAEMRFIKWLVGSLIYEIIETENIKSMKSLYAAIPKIDQIRFGRKIEASEKNEGLRAYAFDMVMEDDAGNPLIVANMNDSIDPTEIMDVNRLVESASRVSASVKSISAAFLVSSSFHSAEALTAADESMKRRFRSRKKENTKVKASRKNKYNLCLVECRKGDGVYLKIPKL